MKKVLLALFILISVNVFSQDTVILKTGEVIACRIGNISNSRVVTYYYANSNGDSVMAQTGMAFCYVIMDGKSIMTQSREAFMADVKPQGTTTYELKRKYQIWVSLYSSPDDIKGSLYEVRDSSILMRGYSTGMDRSMVKGRMMDLYVNDIESIKARRKSQIGWGCLIGALSGCALGVAIGLGSGDDPGVDIGIIHIAGPTAQNKAVMAAIPLGIAGAAIGAAIGAVKVKIPIYGNMETFNREKSKLEKYTRY